MTKTVNQDECMLFAGGLSSKGYARICLKDPITGKWKGSQLHRQLYKVEVADIPDNLVLDHLCRNRSCINTDHLEPVTNTENLNRGNRPNVYGDYCNHGHKLSDVGYYLTGRNCKICKECARDRARKWQRNNRDKLHEIYLRAYAKKKAKR